MNLSTLIGLRYRLLWAHARSGGGRIVLLIGAYLVGAGGSLRHAVGVGAAVSVMHTASVLTLGLLVLSAERLFDPAAVYKPHG